MRADKNTVLRLLKTARGQLDGIIRMVEEDRYCIEIANQVAAADSILRKVNKEIIRAHLSGCVREAFESGPDEQQQKINELLGVMDKLSH